MKLLFKICILPVFLLTCGLSYAQEKGIFYQRKDPAAKQFEKIEWDIQLSAPFLNPYDQREIALDMVIVSPSGKPLLLPCYFERGDTLRSDWKARFAAQESGEYSYHFSLKNKNGMTASREDHFRVAASAKPGFLHKNNLWTFKFDNGKLFRGIGENVAWESRSFEDPKWTYDYLLPALSKNGANFFRTWMCPWNLPLEWQKVNSTKRYRNTDAYFNPGGIKRMDELVQLADSLQLYFMLTLDMNSGNWSNNPYNVSNGGPVKAWKDFFTSNAAMDKYKNKLRYLVARWGYSTSIGAWEFFNEIDNGAFTPGDSIIIPHSSITAWHDEMARYIKDIDPYGHLVTTSISHRDIAGLNAIAYMDFNQKHIYKHTEKIPAIYPDYIQTFGKPYVIGEFGYRWEDQDPKYAREANADYKRGLWYGLFSPTPILPMSWWWELFDDQGMTPYLNGVRTISDEMLRSGHGEFNPFPVEAGKFEAYGMQCGDRYFICLMNNTRAAASFPVSFPFVGNKRPLIRTFSPTQRQYAGLSGAKMKLERLTLAPAKLDAGQTLILIITGKRRI
jgi:hypothetical protein